jgi:hypothetical protein
MTKEAPQRHQTVHLQAAMLWIRPRLVLHLSAEIFSFQLYTWRGRIGCAAEHARYDANVKMVAATCPASIAVSDKMPFAASRTVSAQTA